VGNAGYLNDFWEYNAALDSWTQKTDFPGDPRYECIAFSLKGFGYIGLGAFANILYNDFYEYDSETDSWTQRADYPGGGQDACSAFAIDETGYVSGGSNQQTWFNDFWQWNQPTDVWSALADFPGQPRAFGVGLTIGNKGYMGLGEQTFYYSDWWEYCPDTTVFTSSLMQNSENIFSIRYEMNQLLMEVNQPAQGSL
jgi:N-acetylneuraminic acid mutarotase